MVGRIHTPLIVLAGLLLPGLVLLPMGGIWLWEHHWLAYFGGVSLLWVILMVAFIEWRSHVHPGADAPDGASVSVEADDHWPPSAVSGLAGSHFVGRTGHPQRLSTG